MRDKMCLPRAWKLRRRAKQAGEIAINNEFTKKQARRWSRRKVKQRLRYEGYDGPAPYGDYKWSLW